MAGIYRQRHPERTVLYRVLFHYFEKFLSEYESRFEREHGFLRPVIKDVVEKYLDCGNPMCGFARIRCPDCGEERLLMFSCKTRGFCPSCHSKRREEWGEWMRESLLLDVPHRQVVFTVPKMLRLFFNETAGKVRYQYSRHASQEESMHYLEFIARVTSHIPDKGQVMIRYCGLLRHKLSSTSS
ncbi:MAG: transposase zinc-binding domain-containing protein [Candidatus Aminicenantaceae bacterium]